MSKNLHALQMRLKLDHLLISLFESRILLRGHYILVSQNVSQFYRKFQKHYIILSILELAVFSHKVNIVHRRDDHSEGKDMVDIFTKLYLNS